jgi:hypothetical protein
MLLRDERGDREAEWAVEGEDRDEKLPGDLEALGGVEEGLEISDLRMMLTEAVSAAGEEAGLDDTGLLRQVGIALDYNDAPRVEDMNERDLRRVLLYISREYPVALEAVSERYPSLSNLLTDIAVTNGAGL